MLELDWEQRKLPVVLARKYPEWGRWTYTACYNHFVDAVFERFKIRLLRYDAMTSSSGKGKRVRKDAGDDEEEEDQGEEGQGDDEEMSGAAPSTDELPLSKRVRREEVRQPSQLEVSEIPVDQRRGLPLAELAVAPTPASIPVVEATSQTQGQDAEVQGEGKGLCEELGLNASSDSSDSNSDSSSVSTSSSEHSPKRADEGEQADEGGQKISEGEQADEEDEDEERLPSNEVPRTPAHSSTEDSGGASRHEIPLELDEPLRQVTLGERSALNHFQPGVEPCGSEISNLGYQKLGEAITFLAMGEFRRHEEDAVVADGLRGELEQKDRHVVVLTKELLSKGELLQQRDEKVARLEAIINERDSELRSVHAELAASRAESQTLATAKSLYKRISIVSSSSGFETFREVAKREYPKEDWDQFEFDVSIYKGIAEVQVLDPDLQIPPTPPPSP